MGKTLTPRHQRFIAAIMDGKPAVQAALDAGYSKTTANKRAYELRHKNPQVMAALASAQGELQAVTAFTAERAMARFEEAATFAVQTNNANALVKAREMQAKLAGLMVERVEHQTFEPGSISAIWNGTRDVAERLRAAREEGFRLGLERAGVQDVEARPAPELHPIFT